VTAPISLDGRSLTIEDVVAVARQHVPVALAAEAAERVDRAHQVLVDLITSGQTIYGVTTGLADRKGFAVEQHQIEGFQRRIVLSHIVGVGAALAADVVRAIMLARANMLAAGARARAARSWRS